MKKLAFILGISELGSVMFISDLATVISSCDMLVNDKNSYLHEVSAYLFLICQGNDAIMKSNYCAT